MNRFFRGGFGAGLLSLVLGSAYGAHSRAIGRVLYVNGCPVLQITASAGQLTGESRVARIAAQLSGITDADAISTRASGEEVLILADGRPCLTVTHQDAVRCGTTCAHLGAVWAARMREALSLPALKVSTRVLDMPTGAARTILVVGYQADGATVGTTSASVLRVRRTDEGVEVRALAAGTASVVVRKGQETETVNVTVRRWAADFPQTLSAEVTGIPADGATVRGAVATALRTQLYGTAGAQFEYKLPDAGALPVGGDRTYQVQVRAAASGTFANYGTVDVRVKNVPVPREQDSQLWYSNNPEELTRPRQLFSATLRTDEPARLLYHHINGTTQGLYLRIEAINSSDDPARVVVIPGDSKPNLNPVIAGIDAAAAYFRAWVVGSGEIVTIPAHHSMPISLRRLDPGETSSGLCGLRLLSGPSELLVRTDALPPFTLDPAWRAAVASSTPWREVGCPPINAFDRAPYEISEHVYLDPHKSDDVTYRVGGRYGFLRIGQRAILRQDHGSQLDGNFGVIYNIKATLENPTNEPTDVEIVFEASAGYSGGLFMVDGDLMRTPLLQPKDESRLVRYYLPPGATRRVEIATLPLAGSSYPATLLIRPLPHLIARTLRTKKK